MSKSLAQVKLPNLKDKLLGRVATPKEVVREAVRKVIKKIKK